MDAGVCKAFGLVATNKVRRGASQLVIAEIAKRYRIIEAWSDLEWVVEGADVRVSIICVAGTSPSILKLDGEDVAEIPPALFRVPAHVCSASHRK
jgi:hypothetical protein